MNRTVFLDVGVGLLTGFEMNRTVFMDVGMFACCEMNRTVFLDVWGWVVGWM